MFQFGIEFSTKTDNGFGWNPNVLEIIQELIQSMVSECLNENGFFRVVV
jgi:hypothetical protein